MRDGGRSRRRRLRSGVRRLRDCWVHSLLECLYGGARGVFAGFATESVCIHRPKVCP
jgi:hypothetical protein